MYSYGVNVSCIFLAFGDGTFNLLGLNCDFSVQCAANVNVSSVEHSYSYSYVVCSRESRRGIAYKVEGMSKFCACGREFYVDTKIEIITENRSAHTILFVTHVRFNTIN